MFAQARHRVRKGIPVPLGSSELPLVIPRNACFLKGTVYHTSDWIDYQAKLHLTNTGWGIVRIASLLISIPHSYIRLPVKVVGVVTHQFCVLPVSSAGRSAPNKVFSHLHRCIVVSARSTIKIAPLPQGLSAQEELLRLPQMRVSLIFGPVRRYIWGPRHTWPVYPLLSGASREFSLIPLTIPLSHPSVACGRRAARGPRGGPRRPRCSRPCRRRAAPRRAPTAASNVRRCPSPPTPA